MTDAADKQTRGRYGRLLAQARATLAAERIAAVLAPFAVAALVFAGLALWGVFQSSSRTWTLAVLGVLGALALFAAAMQAWRFRWPAREEARRRVEADSRLPFGVLAALDDAPAVGDPELWALHQRRTGEALARSRVRAPRLGLAKADPYALRWAAVLAIGLGLWNQGAGGPDRLKDALRFGPAAVAPSLAEAGAGFSDPTARALAEAAAEIRDERTAYVPGALDEAPSWYGPFQQLHRAPAGVQFAASALSQLDLSAADPATRAGVGWAGRRLASAASLAEAKAVAAELDRMARRLERRGTPAIRRDAGITAADRG